MIGVIGGTGILGDMPSGSLKKKVVKTPYGSVTFLVGAKVTFLPRHGPKRNVPPHRVNHRANIYAFKRMGVEKIIGLNSVGSLKRRIRPAAVLIPHDYIDFSSALTFYDRRIRHITPGIDEGLRKTIIRAAKKQGIKLLERGIYVQTSGPRLETRAEISMLKNFADVIGMTMASEATLTKELDLKYASICSVDNYAHGLVGGELDFEKVVRDAGKNGKIVLKLVKSVVEDEHIHS